MNMLGHQNWSLFAVFDGHAGVKTAQFVEHALAAQLEEETKVRSTLFSSFGVNFVLIRRKLTT